MTQALAPCPSCSRHVNTTEQSCPFCKSALPDTLTAIPGSTQRLTRAAAFAFTASLAVAGCTSGIAAGGDGGPESGTGADGSSTDGGKKDAPSFDEGGIQPPYGAPAYGQPPFDSGAGD